jgi:hypothetical protein
MTKLELGRHLDRQVSRSCASKDAIDVGRRSPVQIDAVDAVGDQTSARSERTKRINRRLSVASRQSNDQLTVGGVEGVRQNNEAAKSIASGGGRSLLYFGFTADRRYDLLDRRGEASMFNRRQEQSGVGRRLRVEDDRDAEHAGRNCLQQLQPFSPHARFLEAETRYIATRMSKAGH